MNSHAKRSPGARPSMETGLPDQTRAQLLESAAEVFARVGFRRATVREMCRHAGANVAAVNYHFGDKETLYSEVLRHALGRARQKYPPDMGIGPDAAPGERLHAFIHSFLLRILDDSPHAWHGKLMAREMVDPTAALDRLVEQEIRPLSVLLMEIVKGLLDDRGNDETVRRCGMSIVSQVLFYQHCRPVVSRMFPRMQFDPATARGLADHITAFSLAALRNLARPAPAAVRTRAPRRAAERRPAGRHRPGKPAA